MIQDKITHSAFLSSDMIEPRPWVRLLARFLDIYIFSFILAVLWTIISPSSLPQSDALFGLLSLFLWIFVEAFFLSSWGTTLGKWLLRTQITDKNGKKLNFTLALKRSFSVWWRGCAIGFPLIFWFTFISEYSELTKRLATTWDKDYQLRVVHKKIGIIRITIAFLLIATFVSLSVAGSR